MLDTLLHDGVDRQLPFVYHDGAERTKMVFLVVLPSGVWIRAKLAYWSGARCLDVKHSQCQKLVPSTEYNRQVTSCPPRGSGRCTIQAKLLVNVWIRVACSWTPMESSLRTCGWMLVSSLLSV